MNKNIETIIEKIIYFKENGESFDKQIQYLNTCKINYREVLKVKEDIKNAITNCENNSVSPKLEKNKQDTLLFLKTKLEVLNLIEIPQEIIEDSLIMNKEKKEVKITIKSLGNMNFTENEIIYLNCLRKLNSPSYMLPFLSILLENKFDDNTKIIIPFNELNEVWNYGFPKNIHKPNSLQIDYFELKKLVKIDNEPWNNIEKFTY